VLAGTALEVAYFAFEIPTGIVADTYGRRLSIIAGVTGLGLGFVATGLANGVWLVLGAAAFMGFTWTFKSGADEAWVTDEVGVENAGRSFQAGAQAARIGARLNANVEDSRVRATVLSMTNVFGSAGEWGGGPALGVVGNVFGIRAAIAGSAIVLTPALALYGRAIRHHGREPELGAVLPAPVD
jgi:MFS transporter, DHA3 family, tetracycline resistance protein